MIYNSIEWRTETGISSRRTIAGLSHKAKLCFLVIGFSVLADTCVLGQELRLPEGKLNRQNVGSENRHSEQRTVIADAALTGEVTLLHPANQTVRKKDKSLLLKESVRQQSISSEIDSRSDQQTNRNSSSETSTNQGADGGKSASLKAMIKPGHEPLDEDLVNAVVTALEVARANGDISGFGVDVQCDRGVIRLKGMASSPAQRVKLIEVAKNVSGVFAVFESISILSKSQKEAFGLGKSMHHKSVLTPKQDTGTNHSTSSEEDGQEISGSESLIPDTAKSSRRGHGQQLAAFAAPKQPVGELQNKLWLDESGSGALEERRNDTGKGLSLGEQDVSAKQDSQAGLLKQLQKKIVQGDTGVQKSQQKVSALPASGSSSYRNLLKIIAAGETGQSRKAESHAATALNSVAEMQEGPGTMSLPKIKRNPRRQTKTLANVDLIPVDAMIIRGGGTDIKWVGNRTYQTEVSETQRIASTPKRSTLIGPKDRGIVDSTSQKDDLQSVASDAEAIAEQPVKKTRALPSLLLPPSIRMHDKPGGEERRMFATTDSQRLAQQQAVQTTPLLPPVPKPPAALVPQTPPKRRSTVAGSQGPLLADPAEASPDILNTQIPPAIESIPVPLGVQIEGSGVAPVNSFYAPSSSTAQTQNPSFKHRLFRGLCSGVCGGVCGCLRSESLSFGTEGTYLAPIGEGTANLQATNLMTGEIQEAESTAGFAAGQRFWAQLRSNNVGFAAEYWYLGNRLLDFSDYYVPPSKFGSQSNYLLDLNVFDLEYFQQFCCCGVNFRASVGARYSELTRVNTLHGSGKTADVLLNSSSRSSYQSSGFGATMAVAGRVPLRCWGCHKNGRGWNLFWQLRGSILDTDAILQARTEAHAVPANGTGTTANSVDEVHVSWEGATSNGMLQTGLSYQWAIPQCNALGNVYLGFEGHLWQTAPVGLESTSQAFLEQTGADPFGASIVTTAESNPKDLGFAGFVWGLALYH